MFPARLLRSALPALAIAVASTLPVSAGPLAWNDPNPFPGPVFGPFDRQPLYQEPAEEPAIEQPQAVVPEQLRRQIVRYDGAEPAGTIVIDTPNTYLYYVLGQGRAIRYGIGVGREGFTWSGVQSVARKQEWPDWHPPAEMIARQPYLPRFMSGGPGNPLGARAMYLGNSLYRIHGTNDPGTIGKRVSSGCIRLTNDDVIDLFNRVQIGAKVVVLPDRGHRTASTSPAPRTRTAPRAPIESAALPEPERPPLYSSSSASRLY